jgi:hypothetical protein
MNKEQSYFYRRGYKTGFGIALLNLKKRYNNEKLIKDLVDDYNKYPIIEKINIEDINKHE